MASSEDKQVEDKVLGSKTVIPIVSVILVGSYPKENIFVALPLLFSSYLIKRHFSLNISKMIAIIPLITFIPSLVVSGQLTDSWGRYFYCSMHIGSYNSSCVEYSGEVFEPILYDLVRVIRE